MAVMVVTTRRSELIWRHEGHEFIYIYESTVKIIESGTIVRYQKTKFNYYFITPSYILYNKKRKEIETHVIFTE